MNVIGLDIGTSSICAVVVDSATGAVLETGNTVNDAGFAAEPWERLQNPSRIFEVAKALVDSMIERHSPVVGIGISGQMHGILYLDSSGEARSPLYTWQDGRSDLEHIGGKSYAEQLSETTGYPLSTGFGSTTHYYNCINGLVPNDASVFCAIHDYIGMKLAGQNAPLTHISDAASFGLFDLQKGGFDRTAIEKADMNFTMFPQVTAGFSVLGKMEQGVLVTAGIGDNQASFIGSVADMDNSILVNVGTGSQISFLAESSASRGALEARPLVGESFILAGSSLCGGRAYAILESFFRDIVKSAGFDIDSMYPVMDKLAESFAELADPLDIDTQFSGTRKNPRLRGCIQNLGTDNFTPRHFVAGVLWGIGDELYRKYSESVSSRQKKPAVLVGSGNGIRKGTVMQTMLSQRFGMRVLVPLHKEEAAFGAALSAMVGAGLFDNIRDAQKLIRYQDEGTE